MLVKTDFKGANPYLTQDLIFISQPNLSVKHRLHLSFHENCYHVIYSKFDLKIICSSLYGRTICHYEHENTDILMEIIYNFDGKKVFEGSDPNKHVIFLTDIGLNVINNFIL